MSNSEFEAYVAFDANEFDGDSPVSASLARTLLNNAAHLGDESTQVRAKWAASSEPGESDDVLVPDDFGSFGSDVGDDTPVLMFRSLIPVTIAPNGYAVPLRARLAGFSSNGTSTIQLHAVFRAELGEYPGDDADGVASVSRGSTDGWSNAGLVELPPNITDNGTALTPTKDADGNPVTVVETIVFFEVWGESPDASADYPILSGYDVSEYIGT